MAFVVNLCFQELSLLAATIFAASIAAKFAVDRLTRDQGKRLFTKIAVEVVMLLLGWFTQIVNLGLVCDLVLPFPYHEMLHQMLDCLLLLVDLPNLCECNMDIIQ